MAGRRAVVIGGGVIGTSCAYYLLREGWEVTVLEAAAVGRGCSRGNCGLISLSHVLPLNVPGMVKKTLAGMIRPNSPFSIRPRLDPSLWAWLTKFALRCNRRSSHRSAVALAHLLDSTGRLYDELMEEERLDCELERAGCLFVFQDPHHMDHYAATDAALRRDFGVGAERLDRDALLQFEPTLKPVVAGGWFYREDCHVRPDRLVASWADAVRKRGGRYIECCTVQGFHGSGSAGAVRTSLGQFEADAFVVAAGSLSPTLAGELGCRLPIQPGKGYSITTNRPRQCPSRPLMFQDHKVVVTPMQSGYRIGSTMEFAGYDSTLNPRRLRILRDAARLYLHEPEGEQVEEEWFGWRAMTYDSCPIIDRAPALENVWVASGHNMLGVTLAPVTGKLISEWITGREPHLDPRPYSIARF